MNYLANILYKNLPIEYVENNLKKQGESGEELLVDEASVWKRVLDYRVVKYLQPNAILETHAGLEVATDLYKIASPSSTIISCQHFQTDIPNNMKFEYIDIDPFGQPWEAIEYAERASLDKTVWAITSGEILQVWRNIKGVKLQSEYKGKDCWKWVERVYIPYVEELLNAKVQFYYIFPSSVRLILSNRELPKGLFVDCPVYMSWISKYAKRRLFNVI